MLIDALNGNVRLEHATDVPLQLGKIAPNHHNQLEVTFLQAMLKNVCIDEHFSDISSPLSDVPKTYPSVGNGMVNLMPSLPNVSQAGKTLTPNVHKTQESVRYELVDDFVKLIWPYARQASNLIGLDPKILVAQAALETGWGKFIAKDKKGESSNNFFNIKSQEKTGNNFVQVKTTEYIANTPMHMMASFKAYPSVLHSFNDYVALIKNNVRYQEAVACAHDPRLYIEGLHQAGYATDPHYATKILSIYHGEQLQQALERSGYKPA